MTRPEVCTFIYDPVCGCDDRTYGNDCLAASAGIAVAYKGECAPTCDLVAGITCPGAGVCVLDPTDGCDISGDNAECRRICQCDVSRFCAGGLRWDPSPGVCSCVADTDE